MSAAAAAVPSAAAVTSRPLLGKSALVTGGSRGIGAAIAKAFAAAGADVAFSYSASPEKAAEVVKAIEAHGQSGYAIQADHAKQEEVIALVHEASKKLGKIDILVNNAGVWQPQGGSLMDPNGPTPEVVSAIDRMWAINVTSVGTATRTAAAYLTANSTGRVVNVGSVLGERVPFSSIADYAATKAALLGYTKGWARDFGGKNITVNLVQPGNTDTDMNPADGPFAGAGKAAPVGRYGTPEEIAAAVLFLASPAASFVNAAIINVDGGIAA